MSHSFDDWFWCRACGKGLAEVRDAELACVPLSAGDLALVQLKHIALRVSLVRMADQVIARLQDDGVLP